MTSHQGVSSFLILWKCKLLCWQCVKLHVFYSGLVPSRRGGRNKNTKVSIFLKKKFLFSVMALVFLCYGIGVFYVMALVFLMAMAKHLKALQIVKVTNTNHTKD